MSNDTVKRDTTADRWADKRWGWVRWGLRLKLAALGLLGTMFLAVAGATVVAPQTLVMPWVTTSLAATFLVALAVDFAGRVLCVAVPLTQAARTIGAASIGCQLAAIGLLFTPLMAAPELTVPARILLGLAAAGVAQALAAFLFMIYTRSLALELGRPDLARSPLNVLFSFGIAGGSFTTGAVAAAIVLMLVVFCPCVWWLIYAGLAALDRGWRDAGLPVSLFWPVIRLVPTLVVGLLLYAPLYRYGRLLWQLTLALPQAGVDSQKNNLSN